MTEKQKILIDIKDNIPKLNQLYRMSKYGKIYKSKQGKDFCEKFKNDYKMENLITSNVKISIEMYIKRNVDIDAILKCILDAMNNVIYKDDSQITELIIKKYLVNDKNDIKTFIEIFEL
jgi:Holliday junction resolvase RusA-like endonuclease